VLTVPFRGHFLSLGLFRVHIDGCCRAPPANSIPHAREMERHSVDLHQHYRNSRRLLATRLSIFLSHLLSFIPFKHSGKCSYRFITHNIIDFQFCLKTPTMNGEKS
jgi:hypothetical protein